jgi:hypothetical protein
MQPDYLRPVIDHFLLQAAFHAYGMGMTNRKAAYLYDAEPEFRVSTDELVRAALKVHYAVKTVF